MSARVAVAMSGGVDSSVAAALLKDEGHEVFGLTMDLFGDGAAEAGGLPCGVSALAAAADACAVLGIEHSVLDMRASFRKAVIGNFIDEYAAGRTPNPCVRCNDRIKFGQLFKLAGVMGAGKLATGHYARVLLEGNKDAAGTHALLCALDDTKDQSYFLYRLGQDQLAKTVFPVGERTKDEVRALAREYGLPNAERGESQEVCFIPDDDYRAFLKKEWPELAEPGEFVDEGGGVLGMHEGIAFYTVGQRRGLGIPSAEGRLYVLHRDPITRRITLGEAGALEKSEAQLDKVTYVSGAAPAGPFAAEVKIRYRTHGVRAEIFPDGELARVVFETPVSGLSPGQSAVFYQGDRVLGGGLVAS